ncbi:hypothetical protein ACFX2I_028731 [Malus domestica]
MHCSSNDNRTMEGKENQVNEKVLKRRNAPNGGEAISKSAQKKLLKQAEMGNQNGRQESSGESAEKERRA